MRTHQAGFEALADPTRRRLFEALGEAPHSVGSLAARVPVSRPAVSQHLRVLLDAGLVTATAHGTRRIYAVDAAGVAALRSYFDRFWTAAPADFAAAVTDVPAVGDVPAVSHVAVAAGIRAVADDADVADVAAVTDGAAVTDVAAGDAAATVPQEPA